MSNIAKPDAKTPAEQEQAGRSIRERVPRKAHGKWKPPKDRPDPIDLLIDWNEGLIPELMPIRYGRMAKSPFTFLRGASSVMASDLSRVPTTGIKVQASGDCHLMNFGAFATPERNLIFDINDFDETTPAPWDWDLKRLATSIELAGRDAGFGPDARERAVLAMVRSYRERTRKYAAMQPLEIWYDRLDFERLADRFKARRDRKRTKKNISKARAHNVPAHLFPKLATGKGASARISEQLPLIYHPTGERRIRYRKRVIDVMRAYQESLPAHLRVLVRQFTFCDLAMKVVGIGSVGTFCAIALFMSADKQALFLQIKEARKSVLEPFCGLSKFQNHGQRVVVGQHMMQAASDIFLGWTTGLDKNRHFYIRQLCDMKVSIDVETMKARDLAYHSELCGWTLARAHAKSGNARMVAGYLGASDVFDLAIAKFANSYADQTEQDHAALLKAIKAGKIKARDR
ncbi:MAG: DUF2252 domain-containing protein [Candidatus Binataceae bacterium]